MGQEKMKIFRSCIKHAYCPATQERIPQWSGRVTVCLTYSPTFFPQVYILEKVLQMYTRHYLQGCSSNVVCNGRKANILNIYPKLWLANQVRPQAGPSRSAGQGRPQHLSSQRDGISGTDICAKHPSWCRAPWWVLQGDPEVGRISSMLSV